MSSNIDPADLPKHIEKNAKEVLEKISKMDGGDVILATGSGGEMEILTDPKNKQNQKYMNLVTRRPWMVNIFGEIKKRYRNYPCVCSSGEKIKDCCGIKYV